MRAVDERPRPSICGNNVPDPVAAFAARPNFRDSCIVVGRAVGLGVVKSFQRHQSQNRGHSLRSFYRKIHAARSHGQPGIVREECHLDSADLS